MPAHFCGLYGLKPTSGRLTNQDTPSHFSGGGQEAIQPQPGPIARTVADLRLALDVLVDPAAKATVDNVPPVPWYAPDKMAVSGLRIGFYTDNGFFSASPAILCPPFALPALTHGSSVDLFAAASYTIPFNVTGFPAGVVPITTVQPGEESDRAVSKDKADMTAKAVEQDSTGLPVGIQVVARHWREGVVLAIMAGLETRI